MVLCCTGVGAPSFTKHTYFQGEFSFSLVEINCMTHSCKGLYSQIAQQLKIPRSTKEACQEFITAKNKMKMM